MMAILILSGPEDAHALHMRDYLSGQGAEVEIFDSRWFPAQSCLSWNPQTRTGSLRLPGGRRLALGEITAVYWRCYNGIAQPGLPDAEQAFVAYNDARSLFEALLIELPARWVNSWHAYQLHQTKPVPLAMVAALGVPVPETLLSNDPDEIQAFAGRHARLIFKPVQGGAHTRQVTARHLTAENLRNLTLAPVTLQEEVAGTDIRVFVAGARVMAVRIVSPQLDYREDPDPRIEPIALPAEVEAQCRRIAGALDLKWTGIDFRRTAEGRHVFLEANPSPMFMGFEERTGLPLTAALGALLLGREP